MESPDYKRVESLLKYLRMSARALAMSIGLPNPQIFYDIKAGKCGISKALANKIQEKYVNINLPWLLTGAGEMLVGPDDGQSDDIKADKDTAAEQRDVVGELIRTTAMQADMMKQLMAQNEQLMQEIARMSREVGRQFAELAEISKGVKVVPDQSEKPGE